MLNIQFACMVSFGASMELRSRGIFWGYDLSAQGPLQASQGSPNLIAPFGKHALPINRAWLVVLCKFRKICRRLSFRMYPHRRSGTVLDRMTLSLLCLARSLFSHVIGAMCQSAHARQCHHGAGWFFKAISCNFFVVEQFPTTSDTVATRCPSAYDTKPNAFDGESSDDQRESGSVALSFDSADSEEDEVELVSERIKVVPSFGRGKVVQSNEVVPLAVVPCGEVCTSTSQYCEFLTRDMQLPDRHVSYHSETSTSARGDIPAESSSHPVPSVKRILANLGYAPGQYNPNLWVALMGVTVAFGLAEEGEPTYEQFSYLYSITKSKCTGHGGDWESPSDRLVRFQLPATFQKAAKLKQLVPTRADIQKVERIKSKVPAVDQIYSEFLFTINLVKAHLVNPVKSKSSIHYRSA
ncbi:hypothetical protein L3X38_012177 [Prunus dulcis]|uniref:Uncharacterized protein n=1 Tax=Prunus dulcis TaxID=3755 RepID=A0AAD4WIU0_PRUDU|nr:hypothetical protein L3X38_012177 [Prunus dulcis]